MEDKKIKQDDISLKIENTKDELIVKVDENDIPVGEVTRKDMRKYLLIHRASNIFVFNKNKQVLVSKRSTTKEFFPGFYDLCAGGVSGVNEDMEKSAERELDEELGITGVKLIFVGKKFIDSEYTRVWMYAYYIKDFEGKVTLNDGEVESYEFWNLDDILNYKEKLKGKDIKPDSLIVLDFILDKVGGVDKL